MSRTMRIAKAARNNGGGQQRAERRDPAGDGAAVKTARGQSAGDGLSDTLIMMFDRLRDAAAAHDQD
jgi:hypothetical protein